MNKKIMSLIIAGLLSVSVVGCKSDTTVNELECPTVMNQEEWDNLTDEQKQQLLDNLDELNESLNQADYFETDTNININSLPCPSDNWDIFTNEEKHLLQSEWHKLNIDEQFEFLEEWNKLTTEEQSKAIPMLKALLSMNNLY